MCGGSKYPTEAAAVARPFGGSRGIQKRDLDIYICKFEWICESPS